MAMIAAALTPSLFTEGNSNAFFGSSAGTFNTTEAGNTFIGSSAGYNNGNGDTSNTAQSNTFIGLEAGFNNTKGFGNVFIGASAGTSNITGNRSTAIGSGADFGANNLVNATAVGANARVTQSNSLVLGSINGMGAFTDTNVGIGTTAPVARLQIANSSPDASSNTAVFSAPNIGPSFSHIHFGATGDWYIRSAATAGKVVLQDSGGNVGIGTNMPNDKLEVNGIIRVQSLGAAATPVPLCRNSSLQISTCGSSSLRYKTDVNPFTGGLDIVNRLRPISFKWKQDGSSDIGFGAEDVARVEPLFTFNNEKGQIEGVKYDRLSVVLVNAVREQQAQISDLQNQLKQQRLLNEIELRRINATLAKLVRLNRAKNLRRRSLAHLANPR